MIFLVDKFPAGQLGLWPLQTNLFARISFDIILYKNTHARVVIIYICVLKSQKTCYTANKTNLDDVPGIIYDGL